MIVENLHGALKPLQKGVDVSIVMKPVWGTACVTSEARVVFVMCSGGMKEPS